MGTETEGSVKLWWFLTLFVGGDGLFSVLIWKRWRKVACVYLADYLFREAAEPYPPYSIDCLSSSWVRKHVDGDGDGDGMEASGCMTSVGADSGGLD